MKFVPLFSDEGRAVLRSAEAAAGGTADEHLSCGRAPPRVPRD